MAVCMSHVEILTDMEGIARKSLKVIKYFVYVIFNLMTNELFRFIFRS